MVDNGDLWKGTVIQVAVLGIREQEKQPQDLKYMFVQRNFQPGEGIVAVWGFRMGNLEPNVARRLPRGCSRKQCS